MDLHRRCEELHILFLLISLKGCGRESDAEFRRFLVISQGSVSELEYFNILVKDLGYITDQVHDELYAKINTTKRSLHNLIKKLKTAKSIKP